MSASPRVSLFIALTAASPFLARPAFADAPAPRDPAAAETLYKTARDLLAKGDWQAACPKFDASMQLDPVASTLINVAKCHEHDGKLASAWADYQRALVLNQETPGAERQRALGDVIKGALTALEARLPRLRILIEPKVDGLEVQRDGAVLPAGSIGELVPLDPGEHKLHVSAPGFVTVDRTVTTTEGKVETVELKLEPEKKATAVAAPPKPTATPHRPIPIWPFVTGGVGLGLLGAGIAFRVQGASAESTLDQKCSKTRICDPKGTYNPAADNRTKNVDYGLFLGFTVAGGAALGATAIGALVEAVRPGDPKVAIAPLVSPYGGGLSVGGQF